MKTTQSKIVIHKTRRRNCFFMKKTKSHLRLVYKNDHHETPAPEEFESGFYEGNDELPTIELSRLENTETFATETANINPRPETDVHRLLAQLSPVKYAVPGIKIA